MMDTNTQYDNIITACKDIFIKKSKDYGTSWRVLRPISIIDQIYIKAKRIRTIQETKKQMVQDNISDEFKGIINYGAIGLIQLKFKSDAVEDLPVNEVSKQYDEQVLHAKQLMMSKNHDYGEAWRDMSQEALVDMILQKINSPIGKVN